MKNTNRIIVDINERIYTVVVQHPIDFNFFNSKPIKCTTVHMLSNNKFDAAAGAQLVAAKSEGCSSSLDDYTVVAIFEGRHKNLTHS